MCTGYVRACARQSTLFHNVLTLTYLDFFPCIFLFGDRNIFRMREQHRAEDDSKNRAIVCVKLGRHFSPSFVS